MSMNASWSKRIYKSNEGWATIPNFYGLDMIYIYGDVCLEKDTRNCLQYILERCHTFCSTYK